MKVFIWWIKTFANVSDSWISFVTKSLVGFIFRKAGIRYIFRSSRDCL